MKKRVKRYDRDVCKEFKGLEKCMFGVEGGILWEFFIVVVWLVIEDVIFGVVKGKKVFFVEREV